MKKFNRYACVLAAGLSLGAVHADVCVTSYGETKDDWTTQMQDAYHHIAVVYGGLTDKRLYVDGALVGYYNGSPAFKYMSNFNKSPDGTIGTYTGPVKLLATTIGGQVDEFRVMPSAASTDWINADYQQQASAGGVLYVPSAPPVKKGLIFGSVQ